METLRRLFGNGIAKSAIVSIVVIGAAAILGWWRIEAQIDSQIDGKQAPLAQKLTMVSEVVTRLDHSVDDLNRQQGEVVGELRAIRMHFGIPAPSPSN